MKIKEFFDKLTSTLTYIVSDENTSDAIVIDPVLDFDPAAGKIWGESLASIFAYLKNENLKLRGILETHAHADHITGAQYLKKNSTAPVAIGEHITEVQKMFVSFFNLKNVASDGSQFDILLKANEIYKFGSISVKVFSTPGHTPACSSYLIDDSLFVGDAIFIPDSGTGRCDFPGGSAKDLYNSISNIIYKLPDETRIYVGHDYQPGGRALQFQTTLAEEKRQNIHLKTETSLEKFLEFRIARDKTLSAPRLLLPSIQVNINAGHLPPAEENDVIFLKMPIKTVEV
jgi:glyoxylase-like metal-dependent hydrolase (beta-lactamase superfamily II)